MEARYYYLIDGPLLGRLMRCPDTGGTRHTMRSLAAAAGVNKGKIANLLHDRRTKVTAQQATDIASAVGAHRYALFVPLRCPQSTVCRPVVHVIEQRHEAGVRCSACPRLRVGGVGRQRPT
jgi:hypothetical protein